MSNRKNGPKRDAKGPPAISSDEPYIAPPQPIPFQLPVAVFVQTQQTFICISEDKIRNVLRDHASRLNDKWLWLGPFGLFVTFLLVFVTTECKDALGIKKEVWAAAFLLLMVASLIASFLLGMRALLTKSCPETIIRQMKEAGQNTSPEIK